MSIDWIPENDRRFLADDQTQSDLDVFGDRPGEHSLFDLLDSTRTRGGREKLRILLAEPTCEQLTLRARQRAIAHLADPGQRLAWDLHLSDRMLHRLGQYLDSYIRPIEPGPAFLARGFWFRFNYPRYYESLATSVRQAHRFLRSIREARARFHSEEHAVPDLLGERARVLDQALAEPVVQTFLRVGGAHSRFHYWQVLRFDHWLRRGFSGELAALIEACYEIDALRALGRTTERWNGCFPTFDDLGEPRIEARGLVHPFLTDPVPNDVLLGGKHNFLFLTGPNMAGKTTFMKSLGVAVYLAHVGMAVPARQLVIGGLDAITSSLNVEDNLQRGHSFFFSEVRRVKDVAQSLQAGRRILVLFDELFKGTNVKDAVDGSLLVIDGMTQWKSSLFVLSSHLIELEESLARNPRVEFSYFESEVQEGRPVFGHRLRPGVSRERLGMLILETEGVPELLRLPAPAGPKQKAPHPQEGDAGPVDSSI